MSLILDGFVCITLQFYIINFIPTCLHNIAIELLLAVMQERCENIFGRANE